MFTECLLVFTKCLLVFTRVYSCLLCGCQGRGTDHALRLEPRTIPDILTCGYYVFTCVLVDVLERDRACAWICV